MRAAYSFDDPPDLDPPGLRRLLGGKGAGLATMSALLGLPVPPGFTVPTMLCEVLAQETWPAELEEQLRRALQTLERQLGRRLGDADAPLFVSVRSGAAISMPGMLETILNVGATPATIGALARQGEAFAWQSYCRFLRTYGAVVLGIPAHAEGSPAASPVEQAGLERERLLARVPAERLDDPWLQLRGCLVAVFRSWREPKAVAYRRHEGMTDDGGTAATVQAMVFGNADQRSGSGVYFTRNPNSGEPEPYGDYLACAQGEDVVGGTHRTEPIAALATLMPDAYRELFGAGHVLERQLRDMCDIEFTIERGRLWLLQVRPGKRSALAAVRIALDLAEDPVVQLRPEEVLARVTADTVARLRAAGRELRDAPRAIARGLGASPGLATGRVYFSPDDVVDAADRGESVIFVATATSPSDVHAFAAAAGILTASGGLVSHAALVAREWGLPAVVGAAELEVEPGEFRAGGLVVRQGELLTIDGARGLVYHGHVATTDATDDPLVSRLRNWCAANGQSVPG